MSRSAAVERSSALEELSGYWTSELGTEFDPRIAERMNSHGKLVVSSSLTSVVWGESPISLVTVGGLAEYLRSDGPDVAVCGSSTLTATLLQAGIVDELRLIVNPIILGGGLKLFEGSGTVPLELTRSRPFTSGNVLLYYRPLKPSIE